MDKRHDIIRELKRIASELGHTPTRDEWRHQKSPYSADTVSALFGGWGNAIKASGLSYKETSSKSQKFKYKAEKISAFNTYEVDIKKIFNDLGNPETIKLLAQPDTHVEHVDERVLNCYLKFYEWYKPDIDLMLGDFLSADGLSHWPADSLSPKRIVPEAIKARSVLEYKNTVHPKCPARYFICGNHEDWIRQYLLKSPELFDGLDELGLSVTVESLLDLKKYNYDFIPLNALLKIGHAHFTHGLFVGGNHAKKHLEMLKVNIFYGHTHDTQGYCCQSVNGIMKAQSLGCFERLDAPFLRGRPNNWEHAFGVFEFFQDGTFTYCVPNIINGRMSFAGKTFTG